MWFYISFLISDSGKIICLTERLMGPGGTGWNCLLSSWQIRVSNKEKEGQAMGRGRLGKQAPLEWGWELPTWHWNRPSTKSQEHILSLQKLSCPPHQRHAQKHFCALLLPFFEILSLKCLVVFPCQGLKMDRRVGCRERGATVGYFFFFLPVSASHVTETENHIRSLIHTSVCAQLCACSVASVMSDSLQPYGL